MGSRSIIGWQWGRLSVLVYEIHSSVNLMLTSIDLHPSMHCYRRKPCSHSYAGYFEVLVLLSKGAERSCRSKRGCWHPPCVPGSIGLFGTVEPVGRWLWPNIFCAKGRYSVSISPQIPLPTPTSQVLCKTLPLSNADLCEQKYIWNCQELQFGSIGLCAEARVHGCRIILMWSFVPFASWCTFWIEEGWGEVL